MVRTEQRDTTKEARALARKKAPGSSTGEGTAWSRMSTPAKVGTLIAAGFSLAAALEACSGADIFGSGTTAQAGSSKDATATAGPDATSTTTAEKAAEKAAIEKWLNGEDTYTSSYTARNGGPLKVGGVIEYHKNKSVPTTDPYDKAIIAIDTNPGVVYADEKDTVLGFVSDTGAKGVMILSTKDFVAHCILRDTLWLGSGGSDSNPLLSEIVADLQQTQQQKKTIDLVVAKDDPRQINAVREFLLHGTTEFTLNGYTWSFIATSADDVKTLTTFTPDYAFIPNYYR